MNYLIPVFCFLLLACTPKSADLATNESSPSDEKELETTGKSDVGKEWLVDAIEDHFKDDLPKMETITTERYQNYWKAQMEVVYGDLSMEEFTAKWGEEYDLERIDIGAGFLIDAQDYTTIEVTSCELMKSSTGDQFNYQVKLIDKGFNAEYKREIAVIPSGYSYLIDDVKNWK